MESFQGSVILQVVNILLFLLALLCIITEFIVKLRLHISQLRADANFEKFNPNPKTNRSVVILF
jgi:hypothetical protein